MVIYGQSNPKLHISSMYIVPHNKKMATYQFATKNFAQISSYIFILFHVIFRMHSQREERGPAYHSIICF